MKDPFIKDPISKALVDQMARELAPTGYDLVDLVQISNGVGRRNRMQALEQVLKSFDEVQGQDEGNVFSYLVKVRPRPVSAAAEPQIPVTPHRSRASSPLASPKGAISEMYHENGALNVEYLMRNADLLFQAQDFPLSRNIYKAVLKSGANNAGALLGIGRCYEGENKLDEARACYEESIAFYPSSTAYQHLISVLVKTNKDEYAGEVIDRALHLKDLTEDLRYELHKTAGNCWTRLNRVELAEFHFRKALQINPSADEVQSNLGALFLQAGRLDEAQRAFLDCAAANPNNDRAFYGLGVCALSNGNKMTALEHFARSLDLNIQNPTAIYHLVKCAYELKNYSTAERIVSRYIQVAPVNINLLYSLAGLQFHLGKKSAAKDSVARILDLKKDHAGARELLGLIEGSRS